MEPGLNDPGVRRDLKKVTVGMNKRYTLEAAEKLRGSDLPILLAWAPSDRSSRSTTPNGWPAKSRTRRSSRSPTPKTFVPLDQPQRVADEIADVRDAG